MSPDETVDKIAEAVKRIEDNTHIINHNLPGIGLYAMVAIGMIGAWSSYSKVEDLEKQLADFRKNYSEQVANAQGYSLKMENVIGGEAKEVFVEIGGQRYFLEIDGKNVREYVSRPSRDFLNVQVPR